MAPPHGAFERAASRIHALTLEPLAGRSLATVAFLDASVLPLPPDALLVPMTLARPAAALRLGCAAALGSWVGGLYAYALGHFAAPALPAVLNAIGLSVELGTVEGWFRASGWQVLIISGFLPVPWKLFAVGGGLFGVGIVPFALASFVGRALRFGATAAVLALLGARVAPTTTGRFRPYGVAVAAVAGAGALWITWGIGRT